MKKILVVFLALMFLLGMVGCGDKAEAARVDELEAELESLRYEYKELEARHDALNDDYFDMLVEKEMWRAKYEAQSSPADEPGSATSAMDTVIKQMSESAVGGKVGRYYIAVLPLSEAEKSSEYSDLLAYAFAAAGGVDSLILTFVDEASGECYSIKVDK